MGRRHRELPAGCAGRTWLRRGVHRCWLHNDVVLPVVTASLYTLISVKIPARKGVHLSSVLFKVHSFPLDGGPGLAHTCSVVMHGVTRTHLNAPGREPVWCMEQMDRQWTDCLGVEGPARMLTDKSS